jgi:DNA (cytosine-5)-methyltransferase 1
LFKVVDLFAGAGGLSLGFMQTGEFEIVTAVENNKWAQSTYKKNHPFTEVHGDIREVDFKKIKQEINDIDVVIGGPPCQGFSNANRQKNHAVSLNNRLVKEYVRAVEFLQPKVFVMENVGTLISDGHRFFCEIDEEKTIEDLKITCLDDHVLLLPPTLELPNALDIVQNDERLIEYKLSDEIFQPISLIYKASKNDKRRNSVINKYYKQLKNATQFFDGVIMDSNDQVLAGWSRLNYALKELLEKATYNNEIRKVLEEVIQIQRMIHKVLELKLNKIRIYGFDNSNGLSAKVKSYSVYDYILATLSKPMNDYKIVSGVLNAAEFGVPQKRNRFFALGVKQKYAHSSHFLLPTGNFAPETFRTVRDAIEDIENSKTSYLVETEPVKLEKVIGAEGNLRSVLRDSEYLNNNIITANRDVALKRFKALKQGENFHNLPKDLKENTYTDTSRTQNTIYLRLSYDEPSGTVLNVRKSMWIHPVLDRAISVREAARLQTFPDSFVFCGTKDAQYQQVGNAVPPILANAVARQLLKVLKDEKD